MRGINQEGVDLLKSFEKCVLTAYRDQGGVLTIGYGHTGPDVVEGLVIDQAQADELFEKDLNRFGRVDSLITAEISDNQYSACVCLAYNIGYTAFRNSQVLRAINKGEDPEDRWRCWNHVNGVASKGLTNRRSAEISLYKKEG